MLNVIGALEKPLANFVELLPFRATIPYRCTKAQDWQVAGESAPPAG